MDEKSILTLDEWMYFAQKAEAEVERLKAENARLLKDLTNLRMVAYGVIGDATAYSATSIDPLVLLPKYRIDALRAQVAVPTPCTDAVSAEKSKEE